MDKLYSYSTQAIEYPLSGGENVCLNFKISQQVNATPTDSKQLKLGNQYILFILDISGSMAGTAVKTCLDVLESMFQYLYTELGNTNFDLITFNTISSFIDLKEKTLDQRLQALKTIRANGGTYFVPVFNLITELVTTKANQKVKAKAPNSGTETKTLQDMSIVFLSDGQAEPLDQLKRHISALNTTFAKYTRNCEFHTLGFTSSHDARMLNELTLAGTAQGTFQYVESSKDIQAAMDAISGLFSSKKLNGELCIQGNGQTPQGVKVSFEEVENENENKKCWEGLIFLDMPFKTFQENKQSLKLFLQNGNTPEECEVKFVQEKNDDDGAMDIKLNLLGLHETLTKITFRLTKSKVTQEEAEAISLKINEYRKDIDEYVRKIFKLKIASREPLFEMVEDLKKFLSTFTDLVRSNFLNQLNNEQIAKLNSMAYRNVTRKGLLKKLDKRAHKAVPIINEAFEKVKQISQTVDEKALLEKHGELVDKIGCCALTCYNFVEALKDEDCLCISFDISRPEIAVADATRIKIKNIFPTIISARSFMDSAKYALNLNNEASGGFDETKQGSIVKGISSENITAALPIYVCDSHWEVASLLMKPILGWDITLDPVGYSYFQKKTVPFMLLAHTLKMKLENSASEFNQRIHELLLETCIHIIKDDMVPEFQGTMKEDVLNIQEKYLTDGSVRTLDLVQSNAVHLAHIYCFMRMGLLSKPKKEDLVLMLKYMVEEELRRKQTDWDSSMLGKYVSDMLRVDVDKYLLKIKELEEKIAEEEAKEEKAEKVEETKTNEGIQASKEEEKPLDKLGLEIPKSEYLDGEKLTDLSGKQKEAFNEYEELYQTVYKEIFIWIKYFFPEDEFNIEDYSSLEKIGIDTSAKFVCLYMQNKLHAKNADRKSAFTSDRYRNPWNEDAALDFLQRNYKRIITVHKTRLVKNQSLKKNNTGKNAGKEFGTLSDMEFFAKTSDLNAAADILAKGFTLGDLQHLQDILRENPNSNDLVLEKLKMIKAGSWNGVTFNIQVKMRKRFMRKLFKVYLVDYTYYEWKELWFK